VIQGARAAASVVTGVLRKGRLPEGLDAAAADLLWLLNDPGIDVSLVHHRGWGRNATWRGLPRRCSNSSFRLSTEGTAAPPIAADHWLATLLVPWSSPRLFTGK
jgi:hypothetical protein